MRIKLMVLATALFALTAWPSQALATCTTQTFIVNGRVTVCLVCCSPSSGMCTTSCT